MSGGKEVLETAVELFAAYVEIQEAIRRTEFTKDSIALIDEKLNGIAETVARIESLLGDLRSAFLRDMKATLLAELLFDLRSMWGTYDVTLGGLPTLADIKSSSARDEARQRLVGLKDDLIKLIERIKQRSKGNPITVTPIFSAYSLMRAINERLLEDPPGFLPSKRKLREQYNNELRVQFTEWREKLLSNTNPNSLALRKKQLGTVLPRSKRALAQFGQFDRDYRYDVVVRDRCAQATQQVRRGVNTNRHAGCVILRANDRGILDYIPDGPADQFPSKMMLVLVDIWAKLKSERTCVPDRFPSEVFDVSTSQTQITIERPFDRTVWNEPQAAFRPNVTCQIVDFGTIEGLRRKSQEGYRAKEPKSIKEFATLVTTYNSQLVELLSVLSAWVFVSRDIEVDQEGNLVLGMLESDIRLDGETLGLLAGGVEEGGTATPPPTLDWLSDAPP